MVNLQSYAHSIVASHLDPVPVINRLGQGADHVVFSVGDDYVLKISTIYPETAQVHAWACRRVEHLVPAPRIIAAEDDYVLETRMKGVELGKAELSKDEQRTVLSELAAHMKAIHSITGESFGQIREGRGTSKTWRAYLGHVIAKKLSYVLDHQVFEPALTRSVQEYLTAHQQFLDYKDAPHLLHRDIQNDNVLVKDGHVSGIIDFGDACFGDPLFDVALVVEKKPKSAEFFLQAYGSTHSEKLRYYSVVHALRHIQFSHSRGRVDGFRRHISTLERLLNT